MSTVLRPTAARTVLPSWCLSCGRYHWYGACPTWTAAGRAVLDTATRKD